MKTRNERPTCKTDVWAIINHWTILLAIALGFLAGSIATAHAEDVVICTKRSGAMYRIGPQFAKQACGNNDVESTITLSPPRTTGTMLFAVKPPEAFATYRDETTGLNYRVLAMGMTSAGRLAGYIEDRGWIMDPARAPVPPSIIVDWSADVVLDVEGNVWHAPDGLGRVWQNLGQPANPDPPNN